MNIFDNKSAEAAATILKPYIVRWIAATAAASEGGGNSGVLSAHTLNGPYHTGVLAESQAPWAVTDTEFLIHTNNPNAHHNRSHSVTSTSDHTITGSAFQVLGATATNTLGLLTPLADVSGATKEALLKSTAAGAVTVVNLTATGQVSTPTLTATGNLTIDPATDVLFPQAQIVRSDNFTAGYPIVGWQIGQFLGSSTLNAMQIHSLTLDELRTRVFVADEVRVDRGEEFVTKSYGIVAADFVTPSALDGTVTIHFEDSPAINGAIFSSGDYILFRIFDDSSGLSIFEVWGTVTSYADQPNDQQSWTFTLKYGPTSLQMRRGMVAWDWGVTGQGYIHSSVVDTSGAPYIDIRHWTGSGGPYPTASPSPTFTTDVRIGNLITSLDNDLAPTGWGLFASNAFLKGQFAAANVLLNDDGIRIRLPEIESWNDVYSVHFDRDEDQTVFGGLYATWETVESEAWDWQQYIHLRVYGADSKNYILLDAASSGTGWAAVYFQAGLISDTDRPTMGLIYDPNENVNLITMTATDIVVSGAVEVSGHVIPSTISTYDLGSASKTWRKLYVDEIVATTITGEEALGGQTWQYDDGDMYVKSSSSGTRTLYVSNPGAGTMNLDVDGNITVGGTVDGVDVATLSSSYNAHVASANAHHNQAHVFATESGLGADHTVSGLTTGYYIRATGATTAAFAAIVDGDLPATIVRTSRTISTGSGLTGGGDLSTNRSFDLADAVAGDGLSISSKVLAVELSATSGLELTGTSPAKTLQLADTVSGDGLSIVNKVLSVELSATSGLELTGSSPAKTLQIADTVAGAGMTMTSKVLNVIAAANGGITVNANDIGLTWGTPTISTITPDAGASYGSSSNPARSDHVHGIATDPPSENSVNLSPSSEGSGNTFARATHSHSLDVSIAPTWTGTHTFQNNMVARLIRPEATDTYDLGTSVYWWRQQFVSQINAVVFAEQTVQLLGGWFMIPKDAGTLPAVTAVTTTIDFGKAMTPDHIIVVKAHDTAGAIKTEYMQVGSLVSGTTYNVTRDLAGAHGTDPAWADGTPFAVLGTTGSGRVELNAYDTPRISLLAQGAAYNAQTELLRIGDLDGGWGYSGETYGFAVGERATGKTNLTVDATNGLRIFNNATQLAQWDASGNITIGQVAVNQDNIYIASGALEIRNNTTVRIRLAADGSGWLANSSISWDTSGNLTVAGNASIAGWTVNSAYLAKDTGTNNTSSGMAPTDYPFYAGATYANRATAPFRVTPAGTVYAAGVTIDSNGMRTTSGTSFAMADSYRFVNGATTLAGVWAAGGSSNPVNLALMANSDTPVSPYSPEVDQSTYTLIHSQAGATAGKIGRVTISADWTATKRATVEVNAVNTASTVTLTADTVNVVATTFQIGGANIVWHAGNDGPGSGLNADVLDGQDGTYYLNATNINAGTLADARLPSSMTGKSFTSQVSFNAAPTVAGYTMWHAGNDGAASGLDADLLDGQHGSYYRSASNINAGTISDSYLPATMASKTVNGLTIQYSATTVATTQDYGLRIAPTASNPAIFVDHKDNGASYGPRLVAGRNSNASTPAAGVLQMYRRDGTSYALWVDNAGNFRILGGGTMPTNANDTSGTVVGTQTSNEAFKFIVGAPAPADGFAAIMRAAAAVRDFQYMDGRWTNQQFDGPKIQRGIVVNHAPEFGLDYHPDYPAGKVLDEITTIGNLVLATAHVGSRLETQAQRIARLEARVAELERQAARG